MLELADDIVNMFPTGVGMNRHSDQCQHQKNNVPHRRGDEPVIASPTTIVPVCSPQAWG